MWPQGDRACISCLKETAARLEYEGSMTCSIVSFETFGKEFMSVARLTFRGSRSESESCATFARQLGVKAPKSQA